MRFAAGPQYWILSQQFSARKHALGEPINDYIADISRFSKRLKLSDKETMRYFIEGLQGDLQAHVWLKQPKNFQEAESLARMKDIVNKRQGVSDRQQIISQMKTMFSEFKRQNAESTKVIGAAAPCPGPSASDKKLDELSNQMKQIQEQLEQRQQQLNAQYALGNRNKDKKKRQARITEQDKSTGDHYFPRLKVIDNSEEVLLGPFLFTGGVKEAGLHDTLRRGQLVTAL
ncbi:hypothetical protein ACROYT_G002693 [Oculina patagonica]